MCPLYNTNVPKNTMFYNYKYTCVFVAVFFISIWGGTNAEYIPNYWPCKVSTEADLYAVTCNQEATDARSVLMAFRRNEPNLKIRRLTISAIEDVTIESVDAVLASLKEKNHLKFLSLTLLNQLIKIPKTLQDFDQLEEIDLSSNGLTALQFPDAVVGYPQLRTLTFINNSISEIDYNFFKGDFSRTNLSLESNQLVSLDYVTFQHILESKLKASSTFSQLKLDGNPIRCCKSVVLPCELAWLIRFNRELLPFISGSCTWPDPQHQVAVRFQDLQLDDFITCHDYSPCRLDLQDNRLTCENVDSSAVLRALELNAANPQLPSTLILRNTLDTSTDGNVGKILEKYISNSEKGGPALEEIYIIDSHLTRVPASVNELRKLEWLDLSGNHFDVLPAGSLSSPEERLLILNLSSSSIHRIEPGAFQGQFYPKEFQFYLDNNNLEVLDADVFRNLLTPSSFISTVYLNVAENPIRCNCSLAWLFETTDGNDAPLVSHVRGTCLQDDNQKIDLQKLKLGNCP